MNSSYKSIKGYYNLFYLLAFSLYIGRFNIDIGFSLKPFMLVTAIAFILTLKTIRIHKMHSFEIVMLIFILLHSMTAANYKYPHMSIRFIALYLIVLVFFLVGRFLTTKLEINQIEKIISRTGFIGVIISLVYYFIGIIASGMNFYGSNIDYFGLTIDRSTPRLTGVASNDPNILVFYFTLYFFFTITNLSERVNKVGFMLVSLSIILTFSRGAYLAIAFGLIILFITSNRIKTKIKSITITIGFVSILYLLGNRVPLNPINYITNRFSNLLTDAWSGRLGIWSNAMNTFLNNPVFGIGINSIREYNLENYMRSVYVHNSLIEVLVETGIVGISLYMIFWFLLLRTANILSKKQKKTKYLLVTLLAIFLQMNTLSILYNEGFYFVIILLFRYSVEYHAKLIEEKSINKREAVFIC
jgi:O-antigen ligase